MHKNVSKFYSFGNVFFNIFCSSKRERCTSNFYIFSEPVNSFAKWTNRFIHNFTIFIKGKNINTDIGIMQCLRNSFCNKL